MIKYLSLAFILALRLAYQPASAHPSNEAFSFPSANALQTAITGVPAKLIEFNAAASNNKVVLSWTVDENETADRFWVEKSTDGKNYATAALVFGSDKPDRAQYEFYEKAGNHKVLYRIKLVNKDSKTQYSEVKEINPANG